ncbi:MAG: putative toxin-antitoxin system toxin component, PIN family [Nitrospirae bacterium]|nr:putative toxin-antitoxin system toxin component, PIN family [Nitrospirota bacterium]
MGSSSKRVVFDTNVLISAYLWEGLPRKALEIARSGQCRLVVSKETLRELIRVLASDKFGFAPEEIALIINDVSSFSLVVPRRTRLAVIETDPSDNVFLGLAVDAGACCIVSGDHHLLTLQRYRGIKIVRVAEFFRSWSR